MSMAELEIRRALKAAIANNDEMAELVARRSLKGLTQTGPDLPDDGEGIGSVLDDEEPAFFEGATAPVREQGAPASIRAIVGGESRKPEDRLATVRKFFPDAQPADEGEFTYTDPKTGQPRRFNPPGFDLGDVAENSRIGAEMIGGAGGGLIGTTAGPLGTLAGVGLGAGLATQGFDQLMNLFTPRVDTKPIGERSLEAATDVGVNALGQGIGGKLAEAVPAGVKKLKGTLFGATPEVVGGVDNRLANQSAARLQDFEGANVPIVGGAGAITDAAAIQGASSAAAKLPTSAKTIGDAADRTLEGIAREHNRIVQSTGGTAFSIEEGGEAIKRGGEAYVDNFQRVANRLYNRINIPAETRVPLANTVNQISEPLQRFATAENIGRSMVPPQFRGYLADIAENNGSLTWEQARAFRSFVGKMADDPRVISDIPKAQWKQLYSGLSEDLEAQARRSGQFNQYERANNTYRRGIERIRDIEKIIQKPEAADAFKAAFTGSKEGGSKLLKLRRSIPNAQWNDVLSAKLNNMGLANPGAQGAEGLTFSPNTYLTNWNKLSTEAKDAMFRGSRYSGLRNDLDRLARITSFGKQSERLSNVSNTANQNYYTALLTGGGVLAGAGALNSPEGALAGGLVALVTPYGAAKLMTNPSFIRWMAKGVQINPANYNGLAAHLTRLSGIAKSEPDIQTEIQTLVEGIKTQTGGEE